METIKDSKIVELKSKNMILFYYVLLAGIIFIIPFLILSFMMGVKV